MIRHSSKKYSKSFTKDTKSRQQQPSASPKVSSAYRHLILQLETSALPSSINDIHIKITCSPTSVCSILNLANWFFPYISCQYSYPTLKKNNYCLKSHVCIIGCIILSVLFVWSLYEIIHMWIAVVDESEEWSSQLIFQFKQLERRSLKSLSSSVRICVVWLSQ